MRVALQLLACFVWFWIWEGCIFDVRICFLCRDADALRSVNRVNQLKDLGESCAFVGLLLTVVCLKLVLSRIDSWLFCYKLIFALPCSCILIVDKIASANC